FSELDFSTRLRYQRNGTVRRLNMPRRYSSYNLRVFKINCATLDYRRVVFCRVGNDPIETRHLRPLFRDDRLIVCPSVSTRTKERVPSQLSIRSIGRLL